MIFGVLLLSTGQTPGPSPKAELSRIRKHSFGAELFEQANRELRLSRDRTHNSSERGVHLQTYRTLLERAFNQLQIEAKGGNIESMFLLGAYYRQFSRECLGTQEDCFAWLEKSALLGHEGAPLNLALALIEDGSATEKVRGLKWLVRSTEIGQNRGQAAARLVRYYSYGSRELRLKRDPSAALNWAQRGAAMEGMSIGEYLALNGLQHPDKINPSEIQFE